MAEVREMAEGIREIGATEFEDSNHVHRTLIEMHEIIGAAQDAMQQLGERIGELPGVIPEYAEAAHEASGQLSGVADALQEKVGRGITGAGAV